MKRILLVLICVLLICNFSPPVSAGETGIYETAGDLYHAWVAEGQVPDYISGIWSTDGGRDNLTFCLVKGDAGEKGRQEILALIADDSTVTFVYQTYSRNYLYQIQDAVVDEYFGQSLGLVTAGVREEENKVCFEVHRDYAENPDTLAMIRDITEQYGDAVYFSYIDSYPQLVTTVEPDTTETFLVMANPRDHAMPLGFSFILFTAVVSLLIIETRRRRLIAMISDGSALAVDDQPVTRQQIETALRKSDVKPSACMDQRVMRSIGYDNQEKL